MYANPILSHFDLSSFFNGIYGSELNGRWIDKGKLVDHILKAEYLDPKSTLIAGDRSHDIVAGKKNGIITAAVTYGYGTQEELVSSSPDYIFDTFSDLTDLITQQKSNSVS